MNQIYIQDIDFIGCGGNVLLAELLTCLMILD